MLRISSNKTDNVLDTPDDRSITVNIDRGKITPTEANRQYEAANRASLAMQLFPSIREGKDADAALALIPEHVPPGVDVLKNIQEASTMSLREFYEAVRNHGEWDYKQS